MNRFPLGISLSVLAGVFLISSFGSSTAHAQKEKDKTPPIITELRVESITDVSAMVLWTTDEPADSAVEYGVSPKTNEGDISDPTLVLTHAIALSGLTLDTSYAFCIHSNDAEKNKADQCGSFTTLSAPPSPVSGGAPRVLAFISGFAYPNATIHITLRGIPFGDTFEEEVVAASDGSFSKSFQTSPYGLYAFIISTTDTDGSSSTRKGIQFEFKRGGASLYKDKIILPPTIRIERSVIAWGDDIAVSGSTVPNTGVLVEVDGTSFETKSGESGVYRLPINSARFAPGSKVSIRARSAMISEFGNDYSISKTVTLSATSVPKADLNADGAVNIKDFSVFLANPVDMNGDGKVNSADLSIFLRAFI